MKHWWAGFRETRRLSRLFAFVTQASEDAKNLLNLFKDLPRRDIPGQADIQSHVWAERCSNFNLLSSYCLIAAQGEMLRRGHPQTHPICRLLLRLPWAGRWVRDLQLTLRRRNVRLPRDLLSLILGGRHLAMGKVAASEVPAKQYNFGPDRVGDFPIRLMQDVRKAGANLSADQLSQLARGVLATLAQSFWFFGTSGGSLNVVGVPKLGDVPDHRRIFLEEFKPPELSGIDEDFDSFLRDRVEMFRKPDSPIPLVESSLETQDAPVVDRTVAGLLHVLETAATEFSRRPPASADTQVFIDGQARLWVAYGRWYGAVRKFLKQLGEPRADDFALETGWFLQTCFAVCGRREARGARWAHRREFDRWKIAEDPLRRRRARELSNMLRAHKDDAGPPVRDQGLFKTCVEPCIAADCSGNWDVTLLLRGPSLAPVCRFVALACLHADPVSFDRVVGVARSGLSCASMISFITNKPMSLVFVDNVLDLVPQPAGFERWLLVDDAYQTGYTYQLIRSQVFAFQAAPVPKRMFVALKATDRYDKDERANVRSFELSKELEDARKRVGYAAEYRYEAGNRYPILVEDRTVTVSDTIVQWLQDVLTERLQKSRELGMEKLQQSVIERIDQQDGFLEVGLLFDFPDLVLAVGYEIHKGMKERPEPAIAYLCGSAKVIPFVAAACLHAILDGETAPLVLRWDGQRLRYEEVLVEEAAKKEAYRIMFVDTSTRTGQTYEGVKHAIDDLNRRQRRQQSTRRFCLDPGLVCVKGWPTRRQPIEQKVLFECPSQPTIGGTHRDNRCVTASPQPSHKPTEPAL
jgi:hypothetical protein